MIVPRDDLRFVKRAVQVGPARDDGSHDVDVVTILQVRHQEINDHGKYQWTKWEDVPVEEEEETPKVFISV